MKIPEPVKSALWAVAISLPITILGIMGGAHASGVSLVITYILLAPSFLLVRLSPAYFSEFSDTGLFLPLMIFLQFAGYFPVVLAVRAIHRAGQRTRADNQASLVREINARLLPELQKRGFIGPVKISKNRLLHVFKRQSGDSTHELTLQLEKRGLPRFIVYLAIEPPEGFEALVEKGETVFQGRVQPWRGPFACSWFRSNPSLWRRMLGIKGSDPASAVNECIRLLPEIESWWETQASSKHITVLPTGFPGTLKITSNDINGS